MCKTFKAKIIITGTQSDIIAGLQRIIEKVRKPHSTLTRGEGKAVKRMLQAARLHNDTDEINRIKNVYKLNSDYCDTCADITYSLHTGNGTFCAYCNTARIATVKVNISRPGIDAEINEITD